MGNKECYWLRVVLETGSLSKSSRVYSVSCVRFRSSAKTNKATADTHSSKQECNCSKILSKIEKNIYIFLENIASFSCRGCQALSSDMRITILLLIMREKQEFLCKYLIFRKFELKILKNNILKISLHFLVEDAKIFHLICEILFYCL